MKFIIIVAVALLGNSAFAQPEKPVANSNAVPQEENNSGWTKQSVEQELKEEPVKAIESAPASTNALKKEKSVSAEKQQQGIQASRQFETNSAQSKMSTKQRSPNIQQQAAMKDALNDLEQVAPESFEYHLYSFLEGNYDLKNKAHLDQALKMRPNNTEALTQSAAVAFIQGENNNLKAYLTSLKKTSSIEDEVTYFAQDLFASVPKNGVLLTHGFDDMFGCLYEQVVLGRRPDVKLISIDFLQSPQYRNLLEKQGFKLPKSTVVNTQFLNEFSTLNATKNLFLTPTFPADYLRPLSSRLSLQGIVFAYQNANTLTLAELEKIYGGLNKKLVHHASTEKGRKLSANYLPCMLQLKKYYEAMGNMEKAEEMNQSIDKVAQQANKVQLTNQLKNGY